MLCFCFVLSVSLDCPFLIVLSVFSNKMNNCLLNILVILYLIYQRLTTTSIRSHQRSNFKEPINDIMIKYCELLKRTNLSERRRLFLKSITFIPILQHNTAYINIGYEYLKTDDW